MLIGRFVIARPFAFLQNKRIPQIIPTEALINGDVSMHTAP